MAVIHRGRRSERVVKGRNRVEHLDFGLREDSVQRREIGSCFAHGNRRDLEPQTADRCECVVVGRLFECDDVARLREEPQPERNSLARSVAEHDAVCVDVDSVSLESLGQCFAQAEMALRVAIEQQFRPGSLQHAIEGPAKFIGGIEGFVGNQRVHGHGICRTPKSRSRALEVEQALCQG